MRRGSEEAASMIKLCYDNHPEVHFLVRGRDPARDDYHLGYLARAVRGIDDCRAAGFICHVCSGPAVGTGQI